MTRQSGLPSRAPVAVLLGALAMVAAAVTAVLQHGSVLVHQCVADGTAGAIGLRLALLRHDAACPSDQLALGGDARQVFGVVVMIAVPVLAWHAAGLAAAVGVMARVRAGVRTVGQVLAGLVSLPEPALVVVPAGRYLPVVPVELRAGRPVVGSPLLRGPPVVDC